MPFDLGSEPASHYGRLAAELRGRIYKGDWVPGREMPSEASLSEEYGVSGPVVNRALRELASEGLVRVSRGRRSVVMARRLWAVLVEVRVPPQVAAEGIPETVERRLQRAARAEVAVREAAIQQIGDGARFRMEVDAPSPASALAQAEAIVRGVVPQVPDWDIAAGSAVEA